MGSLIPARALPNALGAWPMLEARLQGKRVALFLDYDGTLTPIVASPGKAVLDPLVRAALEQVASVWPTAIVSGRAREDVESLVGLPGLVYAGSHGFDVSGPGGLRLEVAPEALPAIGAAVAELRLRTASVPGALVEDKRYSVAVHYRQVADTDLPALARAVEEVAHARPTLRRTDGKRVFELRPAIDWDKGRALRWMLSALVLEAPDVVPVYVGDDLTDEDAFRAVADEGIGILVAQVPWSCTARYVLSDVGEVRHLLLRLARLGGAVAADAPAP